MFSVIDSKIRKPIEKLTRHEGPSRAFATPPHGLQKQLLGKVLDMGLPSMASFLLLSTYDAVNIYWLARIGAAPVAAVTVFGAFSWVMTFPNHIIGSGSVAVISRRFGQGGGDPTAQAIRATFFLKFFAGTLLGLISLAILPFALSLYGTEAEVSSLAVRYGILNSLCFGFSMVSFSVYTAFRGIGRPRAGMWISVVGVAVNMILDPILIFGFGPIPRMDVLGASIANSIGFITVAVMGAWMLSRPSSPVQVKWHLRPLPMPEMKRIVKIGFPSGFSALSFSLMNSAVVSLFAHYGTLVVALFGMAQRILRFGHMVNVGLGLGTGALVGQYLGAREKENAWHTSQVAIRLTMLCMAVFVVLIWLFSEPLVKIFFSEPEALELGSWYLRLLVLALPFRAALEMMTSSYNGAGRNVPPMIFGILEDWGLVVTLMFVFGRFLGWGPYGMLAGYSLGHAIGSGVFYMIYRRGHWLVDDEL
ncbi:MAG: MATE family efflux transporter [Calditrichaeota bacterium]|nr:MATE family efflux transporter [Calditrichota bacterium]MCB9365767.1 MATE family efflux transporter [Calditrichota bacterium]